MILIEFLLAETVPSEPRPKKTQRVTSSWPTGRNEGSKSMLERVRSSTMPTVKWFFGFGFASSANTPATIAGVSSFRAEAVAAADHARQRLPRKIATGSRRP